MEIKPRDKNIPNKKISNLTNELKNQRVTTPSTRKIEPNEKFLKK